MFSEHAGRGSAGCFWTANDGGVWEAMASLRHIALCHHSTISGVSEVTLRRTS